MLPVLNREQMRRYDALAISQGKLAGVVLMENAGRAAFEYLRRLVQRHSALNPRIAIVCGPGNNGGDGYVLARHLLAESALRASVQVLVLAEHIQIQGDALSHLASLLALAPQTVRFCAGADELPDSSLAQADFIVDALFGTGLSRPLGAPMLGVIARINSAAALRVALDVPSGLDCDTGCALGGCVQAHHTVTFAYPKPGLLTPAGNERSGKLVTVALGLPDEQILSLSGKTAQLLCDDDIRPHIVRRLAGNYKHRSGDILVLAGSPGKTGAARLAAHAALRAGAGLATICTWQDALPALATEVAEIMLAPLRAAQLQQDLAQALARRHAVLVGPGFGTGIEALEALDCMLTSCQTPLVLDADALTLLAQNPQLARRIPRQTILTPHSGELARLLVKSSAAIEADRYAAVSDAARRFGCIVVLKGAHTLIADDEHILVSPWANPVLATAGSGDVLAGAMTALAAQMGALQAAMAAVYLHGLAGQIWSEARRADRGMLAGDIADALPGAIARVMQVS